MVIILNNNLFHYKYLNNDLIGLTDKEAILHYIKNGIYENRPYKLDNTHQYNHNNIFIHIRNYLETHLYKYDRFEHTQLIFNSNNYFRKYLKIHDIIFNLEIKLIDLENEIVSNINKIQFNNSFLYMNLDLDKFIPNNFPIYVYYAYNLIIEDKIRHIIFENCSNYYYTKSEQSLINIVNNIKHIIDDNIMEDSYFLNKKKYYNILNIFDHILIINLKHRTDRYNQIQEQIHRLNIEKNKYEIIEAIYDENGVIGCA